MLVTTLIKFRCSRLEYSSEPYVCNEPVSMGENLLALEGPIATKHPDIFKVKWRLKNFASLREFSYRSPYFKISGIQWNILVYPKVIGDLVLSFNPVGNRKWGETIYSHNRTGHEHKPRTRVINLSGVQTPSMQPPTTLSDGKLFLFNLFCISLRYYERHCCRLISTSSKGWTLALNSWVRYIF